jgi:hypothetical protein
MTPELTRLLAILAAGIVVVVLGVYWWMQRTPVAEEHSDAPLPLFGGLQPGERFTPPQSRTAIPEPRPPRDRLPPVVPFRAPPSPAESMPAVPPPSPPAPARAPRGERVAPVDPPPPSKRVIREFSTGAPKSARAPVAPTPAVPTPAVPPAADAPVISAAGVPGTMVEGHGLRFSVPAEGTLQFLPGRFEIVSGLDTGREIRFVQVPGPNGMEVTFGRSEGELYRHIQLRDKTVSRQHARMQLRDGTWRLVNQSSTNPVIWNGTELASGKEQSLADGDRIEMGEVVFTFRSR